MSDRNQSASPFTAVPSTQADTLTPAGLQNTHLLTRRRRIFVALNTATYAGLLVWLASILGSGGWSWIDIGLFATFAISAPWGVLGIWNALIGLWLLHCAKDGAMAAVAPHAAAADAATPIRARVAIVMTLCNEAPERALARLEAVRSSLNGASAPDAFSYFVLSDTSDPAIAAREEEGFARWRLQAGTQATRMHYRRRTENTGYKAGNLRDFCERWGDDFDFFLPLDADSLMSGETIERMVRIGQAWPRIGILQSLAVGAPSGSLFARIFQFGMRQGMRPYTTGSAWWSGDCGPYWGHNALVRLQPFRDHCHLPELPANALFGGRILSHDQVEAVLMRRAGYEVRVLPAEGGSWEDNPPDIIEFMRRDGRWCAGNLQYVHLLGMKGLPATSRFQLIWAIMMFACLPASAVFVALAAFKPLDGEAAAQFPVAQAIAFYLFYLAMALAPRLAGYADIVFTRGELARYGGGGKFTAGALTEIGFSFLIAPVVAFRTSIVMIALALGRKAGWSSQARDGKALPLPDAFNRLWPQLAFGLGLFAVAAVGAPQLIWWSLPVTLGYVAAIPLAMLTASPAAGAWAVRVGLCAIPEEISPPPEIAQVFHAQPDEPSGAPGLAIAA